jgi:hypothetical protein
MEEHRKRWREFESGCRRGVWQKHEAIKNKEIDQNIRRMMIESLIYPPVCAFKYSKEGHEAIIYRPI